jgi:hypothetical protein
MKMNRALFLMLPLAGLLLFAVTACESAPDALPTGIAIGWGSPEGDDGYSLDYNATPQDVFEAFRRVCVDNGEIEKTDAEEMSLAGKRFDKAAGETSFDRFNGRVYDKSDKENHRALLVVHVRYPGAAQDGGRPDTARSFCFAVHRTLIATQGGHKPKDDSVIVGSEPPVQEDEAVGYFKVPRADALAALKQVVAENGEVKEFDEAKAFITGVRKSKLEVKGDDVQGWVYDRNEQNVVRSKVSVRVRSLTDNKSQQETAKSYIKAVREALEKKFGGKIEDSK